MALRRDRKGSSLVEYVILVAAIGICVIGVTLAVGKDIRSLFDDSRILIADAASAVLDEETPVASDPGDPDTPDPEDPVWDTSPDPFTLVLDPAFRSASAPDTDIVDINSYVRSAPILAMGIDAPTQVSVSGEGDVRLRVNGWPQDDSGSWPTFATVQPNQTIELRMLSAPGYGVIREAELEFGDRVGTFTVQTRTTPDLEPDPFSFAVVRDVQPGVLTESGIVTLSGIEVNHADPSNQEGDYLSPVSVSGDGYPELMIGSSGDWVRSGFIRNGQSLQVRNTSSLTLGAESRAYITVGGRTGEFLIQTTTIGTFGFGARTIAWDSDATRIESDYVEIPGMPDPGAYLLTGTGDPSLTNNVVSGDPRHAGTIHHGTQIAIDVPSYGNTNTASLTVGGTTGTFSVSKEPLPQIPTFDFTDKTLNYSGTVVSNYIVFGNLGNIPRPFTMTSTGGNPRIDTAQNIVSGTHSGGMLKQGASIRITIPPKGQTYTVTFTIDGVSDTFSVSRQ